MKVSIITVVRNGEKTIEETILSVEGQTYKNIEYIIIDGDSDDDTLNIVRKYPGVVSVVISQKDSGIYDAMNKGIALANGDIIGILNSDDIYYNNNVIDMVVSQFDLNIGVDVLYGDLVYVKYSNVNKVIRYWKSKPYYKTFFENGNVPAHPSLFVKRNVYKKVGAFNLDFRLAADYEFMLRIFKKYEVTSIYLSEVLVKMRLGGATNQSFANIYSQNKEILSAWKYNKFRLPLFLLPLRILKRFKQFVLS